MKKRLPCTGSDILDYASGLLQTESMKHHLLSLFSLCYLALSVICASTAHASSERITNYRSDITVHEDGHLSVTETITAIATGNQIKRGIYRDFPIIYTDRFGAKVRVGFDVKRVLRDGQPISFKEEFQSGTNMTRVYMGNMDEYIDPGTYEFQLTYETNRQLGFFDEYDELYWNVTGNGWVFPIDRIEANVSLPHGARILQYSAYTGPDGATGSDFIARPGTFGQMSFVTTKPMTSYEGMTIAVGFPKGIVLEPTRDEQMAYFWQDNKSLAFGLLCFGLLTAYYLAMWLRFGIDPKQGTVIPRFKPPRGFSPGQIAYFTHHGFGGNGSKVGFSAALVNMAIKGYIKLSETKGTFSVQKQKNNEHKPLSKDERALAKMLLDDGNKITLKQSNHAVIGRALENFKRSINDKFGADYFMKNTKFTIIGVLITLAGIGAMVAHALDQETAIFMSIWLSGWTAGVFFLLRTTLSNWVQFFMSSKGKATSLISAIFMTLFAIPFVAGEIFGLLVFSDATSFAASGLLIVMISANFLFHWLLKAPTKKGREILDEVEGFKLFLTVTEDNRLRMMDNKRITPELFEEFMPYAIAMGVADEWAEVFARYASVGAAASSHHPNWYHSHSGSSNIGDLASSLGNSLSAAIASSSTAPGSSSGSGGGGSSGGGGGGGGGGGF